MREKKSKDLFHKVFKNEQIKEEVIAKKQGISYANKMKQQFIQFV